MTNTRTIVSRNKREGKYWNSENEKGIFKVRLQYKEDASLRAYGKFLKRIKHHA